MMNAHVRSILELQASKNGGSSGWHAARQSSGALGSLSGVNSFGFQGTNAYSLVKEDHSNEEKGARAAASSNLATFAHQRVWIAPPSNALMQRLMAFAGKGSRRQFVTIEASLINTRLSFLRDHVVHGAPLVPAAVFIEVATAAAGLLFDATSLEDSMLSSVVFATPMLLVSGEKHSAVPKISCSVNLLASTVEVASRQPHQDAAGAPAPHQRAHFYASLTRVDAVTTNKANSIQSAVVTLLLSGTKASTSPGTNNKLNLPSAAVMATVAVSQETENFQLHPATAEAAVHLCMAHPAARGAGLRVAAKMDATSLSGSALKSKTYASSSGNENSSVWALGMPGQSGKLNSHRLCSDCTAQNAGGVLPLSALEGVQMRRLVTERPAMQQPK
jgi:hypothetical protein